jgi:uncharacterized membrane protein
LCIAISDGSGVIRISGVCTMLIESWPPAATTSIRSMMICLAAVAIAIRPDEHCRSIVIPDTVTGHPARSATCRPILPNCVPWVSTAPHTTSSISPGSMPARSIAGLSENEPKVGPRVALNAPL